MPPLGLYLAFVGASAALIMMPGPNAVLIMARTLSHGRRAGFATLIGTWSGATAQLAIVVAGLTAVAITLANVIDVIRWLGAAYLIVQGLRMIFTRTRDKAAPVAMPRRSGLIAQGFLTGLSNPKSLVFYGAFLPQFIAADRPAGPQLVVLALTFLALAFPGDTVWIFGAGGLRRIVRSERVVQTAAGTLLVSAGAGLALVRRA